MLKMKKKTTFMYCHLNSA